MPERSVALTVFLADDSQLICDRVAGLLQASGMVIVGRAGAPQPCIDGILATLPDVVVLDIQLDGGSGLEVLRAVRQVAPATRFVVFSNNSNAGYRERYLRDGADRFLDKNSDFQQLVQAVTACARPAPH